CVFIFFFFFNDTATTEIYTLSLHDALPIYWAVDAPIELRAMPLPSSWSSIDRKSTRLNSSHVRISYAVFCLKKKNDDDGGGARDAGGAARVARPAGRRCGRRGRRPGGRARRP